MKRHHIVGIIVGICAVGFTIRSILSADIINALMAATLLSGMAVSTFFKDRLPPKWSQKIIPLWMCIVAVSLLLFEFLVLNNLP